MKTFPLPNNLLILLFFLLVLLVASFYPTFQLFKKVNLLQIEVNQLASDDAKLQDSTFIFNSYQTLTQQWTRTLPKTEQDVANFAASTEALARSNSLTIELNFDDFPLDTPIGTKILKGLGTDMTLTGTYQNLTSFLTNLSRLPYFYKIDKIILTQDELKPGVKATLNGILIMQ